MASVINGEVKFDLWHCPIYNREIDEGLCYEIVNCGSENWILPEADRLPCSWEAAYEICKKCPRYSHWD